MKITLDITDTQLEAYTRLVPDGVDVETFILDELNAYSDNLILRFKDQDIRRAQVKLESAKQQLDSIALAQITKVVDDCVAAKA